ncbi:MAG: MarR family transcriptional regulator [Hyphomicrobiaceae bacterium]|nr:MarR family transcriptional regulator [Hyphomicrobiaceae bacterium]
MTDVNDGQGEPVAARPSSAASGMGEPCPPAAAASAVAHVGLAALAADAGSFADERARLVACMELFFFAYRDFTGDPDAMLERYGFGRAHHRVLHFVRRNPGLRVADLLEILRITKQSLARVLKQLVDEGFIVQREGKSDRRERLLYVTPKGARLADRLADRQIERLREALTAAGPSADEVTRRFLFAMIGEKDRAKVRSLITAPTPDGEVAASQDRGASDL